jgi:hypothetical protein
LKKKAWLYAAFLLITALIVSNLSCAGPVKNEKQLQSATENMGKLIQSKLSNLDNALSDAAVKMARTGLTGDGAREILEGLCKKYPYLVDCAAQDNRGTMVTLAPESARQYEGINTSKNEVSTEFFANKEPLLSNMFRAVQGFDAIVVVRPIITEKGELMGSVSGLFRPEALLDDIIRPQAEVRAIKVNVVQTDGLCIYCSNGAETGKNVLTDPSYKAYPELVAQGAKMTSQKTGSASYIFPSVKTGQPVKKTMTWVSVGLHGTDWRIASIAELGN